MEGTRIALVLGLVLIAGIAIEQAPSSSLPWYSLGMQSYPSATSQYTENASTKSTESSIWVSCSHEIEDTSNAYDVELALQNHHSHHCKTFL